MYSRGQKKSSLWVEYATALIWLAAGWAYCTYRTFLANSHKHVEVYWLWSVSVIIIDHMRKIICFRINKYWWNFIDYKTTFLKFGAEFGIWWLILLENEIYSTCIWRIVVDILCRKILYWLQCKEKTKSCVSFCKWICKKAVNFIFGSTHCTDDRFLDATGSVTGSQPSPATLRETPAKTSE